MGPVLSPDRILRPLLYFILTAGIFLLMRYNYLMFHTLVEVFSVTVAWGMFMVAWNTRQYHDDGFFLFLGISFLAVGLIDAFHLLTYEGMGVVSGRGADLPTQLWVAARFLQALALALAPLFLTRPLRAGRTVALTGLLASVLVWAPLSGHFPACFREGEGLTWFKIGAEVAVALSLLGAILFLHRRRERMDPSMYRLVAAACGVTAVSELLFTLYASPFGFFNFLGHLLKLSAYALLYRAMIGSVLARPLDVLFRSLSQAEARYRSLVQMSPDAVFINRDGRIAFVNPAGVSLFGAREPRDIVGRRVLDLFSPEYHEQVMERIKRLRAGEPAPLVEESILRLDGTPVPVEVAATSFSDAEGDAIQVVLRDIRVRKRAEELLRTRLRLSELARESAVHELMRAAADEAGRLTGSPIACFHVLDEEGRVSRWAESGETIRLAEAPGGDDLMGELQGLVRKPHFRRMTPTVENRLADAPCPDPSAESRITRALSVPRIRGGRLTAFFGVANKETEYTEDDSGILTELASQTMDLVARKLAEERLQGLNLELEARVEQRTAELTRTLRDLESFSYSISHDLRAPVRAINGYASIVLEENGDCLDEEARRRLASVIESGNRMGLLIDELLAYFRLSRRELPMETIEMGTLARSVYDELLASAGEGRVVDLVLRPLPAVRANPELIRRVWLSLLDNAIKYTRDRARARIEVEGWKDGSRTVFAVRDNGIGFEMKYAVRIFGVFQRLHLQDQYEGNGIGLSFVQKIVERHGGTAWAEGEPGRGASFYFSLPETEEGVIPPAIEEARSEAKR